MDKLIRSMSAQGLAFLMSDGEPLSYHGHAVTFASNVINGNVTIYVDGVAGAEVRAMAPAAKLIDVAFSLIAVADLTIMVGDEL